MFYLNIEDVLELYSLHVGSAQALNRPDLLESAVALPQATMFGEELYPHLFTKAAALLRSIAQNQAFIDGNKRIAWIATRVFLAANGIDILVSIEEGLGLMNGLAERKLNLDEIGAYLAEHGRMREDAGY
ncbi:MAG TPA: type II toxin-antitoxin system death-on-curing family toxin [Candidatus Baltobacteraceae bacterium]|nr:type II toxin-antitoxin system death-on-curing family toxin [Candidatus Baltobacteraceae bacterium]